MKFQELSVSSEINKKKKINVSRNKKVYWRKHTDIKDVDEFLSQKRLEERVGGPFKNKKDEELFVIDTSTNDERFEDEKKKLTKKQRALLPPRCFEILKPLTAVPDPIVKRNRVKSKEERKSSIRKAIEEKKRLSGYIPRKVLEARRSRIVTQLQKKLQPKEHTFNKNLWDCKNTDKNENLAHLDWLNDNTLRHNLTNLGAFKFGVPKGIRKKKSVVPTIELPHPGSSYNPSFNDHQELLKIVADRELEKQKEEAHIKRVTSDLFNKVTRSEKASLWMEEMSQGLPQTEEIKTDNNMKEENEESTEYKAINPPVSFLKKKTKKQRRKQKLEKEEELKRKEAKLEKKKVADLYKLRFISNDIKNIEKTQVKNLQKRQKLAALNVSRTKRLGGKQYEEQDHAFSRGCELKGNLRSVKREGNVLADRFYSLQKRNMLVPSVKRIRMNKAKVKSFVRASHRLENVESKL